MLQSGMDAALITDNGFACSLQTHTNVMQEVAFSVLLGSS
jgi:hypothetical protein